MASTVLSGYLKVKSASRRGSLRRNKKKRWVVLHQNKFRPCATLAVYKSAEKEDSEIALNLLQFEAGDDVQVAPSADHLCTIEIKSRQGEIRLQADDDEEALLWFTAITHALWCTNNNNDHKDYFPLSCMSPQEVAVSQRSLDSTSHGSTSRLLLSVGGEQCFLRRSPDGAVVYSFHPADIHVSPSSKSGQNIGSIIEIKVNDENIAQPLRCFTLDAVAICGQLEELNDRSVTRSVTAERSGAIPKRRVNLKRSQSDRVAGFGALHGLPGVDQQSPVNNVVRRTNRQKYISQQVFRLSRCNFPMVDEGSSEDVSATDSKGGVRNSASVGDNMQTHAPLLSVEQKENCRSDRSMHVRTSGSFTDQTSYVSTESAASEKSHRYDSLSHDDDDKYSAVTPTTLGSQDSLRNSYGDSYADWSNKLQLPDGDMYDVFENIDSCKDLKRYSQKSCFPAHEAALQVAETQRARKRNDAKHELLRQIEKSQVGKPRRILSDLTVYRTNLSRTTSDIVTPSPHIRRKLRVKSQIFKFEKKEKRNSSKIFQLQRSASDASKLCGKVKVKPRVTDVLKETKCEQSPVRPATVQYDEILSHLMTLIDDLNVESTGTLRGRNSPARTARHIGVNTES